MFPEGYFPTTSNNNYHVSVILDLARENLLINGILLISCHQRIVSKMQLRYQEYLGGIYRTNTLTSSSVAIDNLDWNIAANSDSWTVHRLDTNPIR